MQSVKIMKFMCIFYNVRNKLSHDGRKVIYFAFIHSPLYYDIEIYNNTYITHLQLINVKQLLFYNNV